MYSYMFPSLAATADPCNPPSKVENAVVATPYQKEYLSGSAVTYRCRDKYTTMDGEDTILCHNGTWEMKEIKCARTYKKKYFANSHTEKL